MRLSPFLTVSFDLFGSPTAQISSFEDQEYDTMSGLHHEIRARPLGVGRIVCGPCGEEGDWILRVPLADIAMNIKSNGQGHAKQILQSFSYCYQLEESVAR